MDVRGLLEHVIAMDDTGIQNLYRKYKAGNERAKEFLSLEDWVSAVFKFDPKTARPLSQGLSEFLWRISRYQPEEVPRDPVWRIAVRIAPALRSVFRMLDEDPRRELVPMRLRKVRELDDASLRRLSTRPGRNIREKIAAKPTLLAPRRFMSIDVPENRLTKAFVRRLLDLLEERRVHLGEDDCSTKLLPKLRAWLRTDESRAIGRWTNTPPNNALLSHRDYRKIWDSWRKLLTLERLDWQSCDSALNRKQNWKAFCENWVTDEMSFADAPVQFCDASILDALVETYDAERDQDNSKEVRDHLGIPDPQMSIHDGFYGDVPSFHAFVGTSPAEGENPLCIDLASYHPDWATPSEKGRLIETFLHQRWTREEDKNDVVEFDLFHATGFTKGRDGWTVETVGLPDLLFQSRVPCAGAAARSFCEQLKESFGQRGRMVWLVPDATSDFAASELRSAMSLAFPFAEPLPRSVAAVMEHIPYQSLRPGFRAVVIDRTGVVESQTQLIARRDERLRKSVPETHGYYWERQPTATGGESVFSGSPGFPEWPRESRDWNPPDEPGEDQISWRSPDADCVVTVRSSPTEGGIRFLELAANAKDPDTSLWKDCLPPLSMGGIIRNGMYAEFVLVGETDRTHTTILPKRGEIHAIPVQETFVLPAMSSEQKEYRFQLRKGNASGSFPYEAVLRPGRSIEKDINCKLELTYEYGAKHPYRLVFVPPPETDLKPMEAEWGEVKRISLQAFPPSPRRKGREELQHFEIRFGDQTQFINLFDECRKSIESFCRCEEGNFEPCVIRGNVQKAQHGRFVNIRSTTGRVARLYETRAFNFNRFNLRDGITVYCFLLPRIEHPEQYVGKFPWVAQGDDPRGESEALTKSLKRVCKWLKIIFSHAESVKNIPENLNNDLKALIDHLPSANDLFNNTEYRTYAERCVLVSSILSRRSDLMTRRLPSLIDSSLSVETFRESLRENPSPLHVDLLSSALRNLSQPWQNRALEIVGALERSYQLETLGIAIWRHRDFVTNLKSQRDDILENALLSLPDVLSDDLVGIRRNMDNVEFRSHLNTFCRHLEFLLGTFRLRIDRDSCPEVLLATNDWTESIVCLLDNATSLLFQRQDRFSISLNEVAWVQVDDPPEKLFNTPSLIFACRSHLTNDQDAGAVQVLGVGETLEDNNDE